MLINGSEKLERMRDGRVVYIGAERVDDVTTHPAFRNGARTIAAIYDLKADPAQARAVQLRGERRAHRAAVAALPQPRGFGAAHARHEGDRRCSYGMIGRSPDHVAGLITGLAMRPELLNELTPGFGDNLIRFYERARRDDLYLSFAVTPPSGIRDREIYTGIVRDDPTLQVVGEDDSGVIVSGMKMLATGAIFGDEVYIGNLTAIDDSRKGESITAAIPNNAPGVSFWAREPYERHARHEADYPLSYRFDENDAVLVCDRVENSVGAGVPAQQRRLVAPHLYRDAGQRLSEPAVQHPVLGQDGADRRAGEPHVPGQRRRQGAGGARDARPPRRARSHHRRPGQRPDRGVRELAGGLRHAEPAHGLCGAELVPGASHRDHRHACARSPAPRRCRCRRASILSPTRS